MKYFYFFLILSIALISCEKNEDNLVNVNPETPETQLPTIDLSMKFEMIDLGLPSGTHWANMNVGASSNAEVGEYYSWGEVVEFGKHEYSLYHSSTNLNEDSYYVNVGNNICGTQYDVATKELGAYCCLPSIEQYIELLNNCKMYTYNLSGTDGYIFVGQNGNSIFFPGGGYKSHAGTEWYINTGWNWKITHHDYGKLAYWSGSLVTNSSNWGDYGGAWAFNGNKVGFSRDFGLNIRAVGK